jgi:predicted AlkP superfamily pyrophosphatase or phosphodiesterase
MRSITSFVRAVSVLFLPALLTACSPHPAREIGTRAAVAPPELGLVTDHLIIISMDGLRPDAITRFGPAMLERMRIEGSHSLEAQTIVPSRTLPGHMSMVSGEPPDIHGVVTNLDPEETRWVVDVPTMFSLAHEAGYTTAAFFSKKKFRQISEPGALDHVYEPTGWPPFRQAWSNSGRVISYLSTARPNLLFIHFAEPDYIGHAFTWMSPPYRWAVAWTDRAVARVIIAADEAFGAGNYTVLLTSDHGGYRFTHGSADPVDTTIPWLAWGRGVRMGVTLQPGIRTMDTAATVLWLLGVDRPADWIGEPIHEAFDAPETPGLR